MIAACALMSLGDVRAGVGAPVIVAQDQRPAVDDGIEGTTCIYTHGNMTVSLWLGRGSASKTAAAHRAYAAMKQPHGAEGLRGNTQVIVGVVTGSQRGLAYNDAASAKLLAAVLNKL